MHDVLKAAKGYNISCLHKHRVGIEHLIAISLGILHDYFEQLCINKLKVIRSARNI